MLLHPDSKFVEDNRKILVTDTRSDGGDVGKTGGQSRGSHFEMTLQTVDRMAGVVFVGHRLDTILDAGIKAGNG